MPRRNCTARLLSTALSSPLRAHCYNRLDCLGRPLLLARCIQTDSPPAPPSSDDTITEARPSDDTVTDASPAWSPRAPVPLRRINQGPRWPGRVVQGDLDATLDAHRSANRDSLVRPVLMGTPDGVQTGPPAPRLNRAIESGSQIKSKPSAETAPTGQLTKDGKRTWPSVDALIDRLSVKQALSDEDVNAVITVLREHRKPVMSRPTPVPGGLSPLWSWSDNSNHLRAAQPWRHGSCPWLEGYSVPEAVSSEELCEHELEAFAEWIQPNADEQARATQVYDTVARIITRRIPTVDLHLHGSRATGLADACTDIDIVVTHKMFEKEPDAKGINATHPLAKRLTINALYKLEDLFEKDERFADVQVIRAAQIPLVTMRHKASDLRIEISANSSFKAVREMTRYCMHQFPHAKPIYLLLRQVLIMRGLYGALDGGMSSYPLFIMVVAALDSTLMPPQNLGAALKQVLQVWHSHDTRMLGATLMPMRTFSKWDEKTARSVCMNAKRDETKSDGILYLIRQNVKKLQNARKATATFHWHENMLTLQDPANPQNDLGKKCYRIHEIASLFGTLGSRLAKTFKMYDNGEKVGSPYKSVAQQSILESFVAGRWESFTSRRARLQRGTKASKMAHRDADAYRVRSLFGKPLPFVRQVTAEDADSPGRDRQLVSLDSPNDASREAKTHQRLPEGLCLE